MKNNQKKQSEKSKRQEFNSLFGFSFGIALLPDLSLDLKQPLLKLSCSDSKSETAKTQWYSKDNPHQQINGHGPSFNDQSASSVTVCNVKYISCPVQCQLSCQWAVLKFCAPFGVWKLEEFFGSAVTDSPVVMAQGTSSCTTNCHQEWSQRLKGTHWERQQKQQNYPHRGTSLQCVQKKLSLSHSQTNWSHSNTFWVTVKAMNNWRSRRWIK